MLRLTIILFILANILFAQNLTLSGKIINSDYKPLRNANVLLENLNRGTTTDNSGFFSFNNLPNGNVKIIVSYVGYETYNAEIVFASDKFIEIKLRSKNILLHETLITAKHGETPHAFNNIFQKEFENKIGSKEAVYALSTIPSVFISPQGGGVGDLRLNMRGFGQTNIAVMIDGSPVNNPENGEVYWTNWAGMSDIISEIQVQRGIGFVPYSVSSVGGNVNFITSGNNFDEFIKFSSEFGADNFNKQTISFAKHLTENISLLTLISKKKWDGYADKTWLDEYTYFLSLNVILDNHSLKINFYGSPQSHGQRLTMQSINFWKTHGSDFNTDWGYLNGKPLNLRDNVFHKPTISLSHQWNISDKVILSNNISYSIGEGGGTVPSWTEFDKTKSGLIDFDKEYNFNTSNVDTIFHPTLHYAPNALRFTVHKHYWTSIISSLQYQISDFYFAGGIDFKYYSAENYRKIENLLGGDYTLYSSNINRPWNDLLFIGDKVDYNADSFTRQLGTFLYTEYSLDNFLSYINLSLANVGYKRIDYFNYLPSDPKHETGWKYINSYTLKGGLNYKVNGNNFYFNIGYFTKPPLSENVFDYSNNLYSNIVNEKIFNTEFGYGFESKSSLLKINLFRTQWRDKAFSQTIQDQATGQFFFTNISGGSALHKGLEIEAKQFLTNEFFINASVSISKNKWINNIDAIISPESNPTQQTRVQSFIKNTFVGGFPMQIFSLETSYQTKFSNDNSFFINPVFTFYGNQYAQFNPNNRSTMDKNVNSWKVPDYFTVDLHLGYKLENFSSIISVIGFTFDVFNLLDKKDYIVDAYDGINHNSGSSIVWMGRERWWHLKTTFQF